MALLDGKVGIVTGAGRGLGREHALGLAKRGAKVIVNDLGTAVDGRGTDNMPAEQVVAEIKAAGGEAIANYADVTNWEQSEALIQLAYDTWGKLDILVNNAGILRDRMIWNMTEDDWDAVMSVHCKSTFVCTRHASVRWRSEFKKTNKPVNGRIINTVSGAMFGSTGQSNYGAAKAAIMGFTLASALEFASMGVTVNAIRPSAQSRMSGSIPPTGALAEIAAKVKAEAEAKGLSMTHGPELVSYLASDAASFISGQLLMLNKDVLELDKGWHVHNTVANRGGKYWTAEDLVTGAPKVFGAGAVGLIEFIT